jgi:epoxyqueuosine reductase QueG
VGFATLETMSGGPPGADLTYLLPEAQSAISFAMPLNMDLIRPYLAKEYPNIRGIHEKDNIETNVRVGRLSRDLRNYLREKGFKAEYFIPNNYYRQDIPGWQASLPPELSLRYLAVRSGVASFGWSGNVGIKKYGANIIVGGVVTDAKLTPTDPIPSENSFCNKCKLCTKVCGFRMFSENEETSVTLGGYTMTYSKRLNKSRCLIVCGGCNGLDKTGEWSTWSPGRYDYPEDDREVSRLLSMAMTAQSKRPLINDSSQGYKAAFYGGKGIIQLTCGNCQLICWGDPEDTAENYRLLTNSGCVIQNEDGKLVVLPPEKAIEELNKMDPKRKRLYYKDYKKRLRKPTNITQLIP